MNAAGPAASTAVADGTAVSAWLPDVLSANQEGGGWHFGLHIDGAAPVFNGHFPELPVLPGVAQLQWALELYQRYSGDVRTVRGVRRLKFQRIVGPGERFELICELRRPNELHFVFSQARGERLSSGQVLLGPSLNAGQSPSEPPIDPLPQERVDAKS